MKKSFLLYQEWEEIVDQLTDGQAGKILKAIFDFNSGKDVDLKHDLGIIFIPIRQTLQRDIEKWENIRDRNIENGKRGGRPKLLASEISQDNPKNPNGYFNNPKNLVNVNVNDNVSNNKTLTTENSYKNKKTPSNLKGVPLSLTPELKNKIWEELEVASAKELAKHGR